MAARSQTLAEACAPIFLYLTTFRRNSAASTLTIEALRSALVREFEKVRRICDEDFKLRPLFERAEYALVAAADQVILASSWPQKAGWSVQLLESHLFKTAEGGKKFFRVVDEVLADPGEGAVEIAEVLFACMALGFQGELLGEPRELERRRRQLYEKARLPGKMGDKLTPEAYGRDVPRKMPRLPTLGILRLAMITVAALVFALIIHFMIGPMFAKKYGRQLTNLIEKLEEER
jgi:type VI secretion system protein ImpK